MGTFYNPKMITDGLILHHDYANTKCYPGSGTSATDLTGHNYAAATLTNNASFLSTNLGCMDFGLSTHDSVQLHDDFGTELNGTNNWTMSQWLNLDAVAPSTGSSNAPVMFNFYGSGRRLFWTMGDGGEVDKIHMRGQIAGTWQSPVSSETLALNTWYHICFTYNASTGFKAYTNGSFTESSSFTPSYISTTSGSGGNRIGTGFSNRKFDGRIAVASLYNKELTASEVLQNFNSLKNRFA